MGLTNFPNGVSSYGMPVLPGPQLTTGSVFFVDSTTGKSANSGKSPLLPRSTVDLGNNLCTANKGDIIYVMPNHAESITTAAALALDTAGVSVIGLGRGEDRPTLTFTTCTAADIDIDAANVSIKNIVFKAGVDSLAAVIDVNASDFLIEGCDFRDTSLYQTVTWMDADANADRLQIKNCKVRQLTAGAEAFINYTGLADIEIIGCDIVGDYSVANISNTSTAATDIFISGNNMDNLNAVDVNIDLVATTDGTISYNTLRAATDGEITWIDTSDCQLYENYGVNADNETGMIIGTASAT